MIKIASLAAALFCAAASFAASFAAADDSAVKSYGSAGEPSLQLHLPKGWQDHTRQPPPGSNFPPIIQFSATEAAGAFSIQITYFGKPPKPISDDDVLKLATVSSKQYEADSVEKKTDLKPLKGNGFLGYYATFTDPSADPGKYACETPLTARIGNGLAAVSIMHQKDSKCLPIALEMLRTATVGAPATQPAAGKARPVRVISPGEKWALLFDLPGAAAAETEHSDDGTSARLTTATSAGLLCTTFIEPAANAGDAVAVRKFYWDKEQQAPIEYTDIHQAGDSKLATVTCVTEGMNADVHGYLVHEGKWIDIHLSHPGKLTDSVAMLKAVESARFEAISAK